MATATPAGTAAPPTVTTTVSIGIDGGASNSTLVVLRATDGAVLHRAFGPGLNPWTQATAGSGDAGDEDEEDKGVAPGIKIVAAAVVNLVAAAVAQLPQPSTVDVVGASRVQLGLAYRAAACAVIDRFTCLTLALFVCAPLFVAPPLAVDMYGRTGDFWDRHG